jgi:hypothetical protein
VINQQKSIVLFHVSASFCLSYKLCLAVLPCSRVPQVLRLVVAGATTFDALREQCTASMGAELAQLGMAQAMKRKLLSKGKDGSVATLVHDVSAEADSLQAALAAVGAGHAEQLDEKTLKELKDRKMVKQEYVCHCSSAMA